MNDELLLPETWSALELEEPFRRAFDIAGAIAASWACAQRGDTWAHQLLSTHQITVTPVASMNTFLETSKRAQRAMAAWMPRHIELMQFFATRSQHVLPRQHTDFQSGYRHELLHRLFTTAQALSR